MGVSEAPARAQSREILDAATGVVLDEPVPMKELAQRMACDASFITAVADKLEGHGLIRREPGQRDRRVKHLVLTADGIAARERMMTELARRMPWCHGLDDAERGRFLALLRKMIAGTAESSASDGGPGPGNGGHE